MKANKFTEDDKVRIKKAVSQAESTTSGEIVTFFVEKSDHYEEVRFRSTLMFIAAPLLLLAILSFAWLLPFHITPLEIAIVSVFMGSIGYFLPIIFPGYKRLLLSQTRLRNAVERRAMAAFLSEELFSTENRTGILIFVSYFEHMVEVMGDAGINAKVDQNEWENVVNLIIKGIHEKDPVGGMERGILKCGELLTKAGVDKPPDNPNELSDDLRIS